MYPVLLKIGSITIYTYGFLVFIGVLCGYVVCMREAQRQQINRQVFSDIFFWTVFIGFIGARFSYLVIEYKSFFEDPLGLLFNRGGFVFYGGVLSGFLAAFLLTKKYRIPFLSFLDIMAVGIPLGHAFGRLGCFSYGCCYGRATGSSWGVVFPLDSPAGYHYPTMKLIPAQLIEAFFLLAVFAILLIFRKRKRFNGQLFLIYLISYGFLRFIVEFFRGDLRGELFSLSTSQIIAIILLLCSFVWWRRWSSGKHP
ncbi:MAG: prolipoprotein diacylglyceryl transferase [Candidatus Omnitrophota bacterium]